MKPFFSSLGALAMGLVLLAPQDARACGGCFHIMQGGEVSQVVGHRMIFSVSPQATTLWDQIAYSGSPESFAWVLPIHGEVDVGLSSDALFEMLTKRTNTQVFSPSIDCPTCPTTTGGTITTYSTTDTNTVTVIAQETVGPYETVQLGSSDPLALETWLDGHGYAIPAEVVPIIDAYVAEGFDFLVMKLVPGQGVDSMQPVRVTSPGAGLTLPLRMVAAGTGVMTPITLWIAGEGRYAPTNFPSFEVKPDDVVWDWDTQSSNYAELKQQGFDASGGKGWLVEAAIPLQTWEISSPLKNAAEQDPVASGYGETAAIAVPACDADIAALFGNLDANSVWLTRLHAELPKAALADDLDLGAAASQASVQPVFFVSKTKGTAPMCPSTSNCGGAGGATSTAGNGGSGGGDGGGGQNLVAVGGGCSVGGSAGGFAAVLAALGLSAVLRRRRR